MKDILVIEPSGNLYGSEMVLLDIIKNSNADQYTYTIVLPPECPFSKVLARVGFKTYEILAISNKVNKILSYLRLFILVIKLKPDLIFVNQAGIQKVVSLIALLTKTPVASEVSTLEDALLVNKFTKKILKPVNAFICNSKFIAEKLHVPVSKKNILYYGYEWKSLNPVIRKEVSPFRIALLGRISRSKGHFLLVEAMAYLNKKRPDICIEAIFIGSAPEKAIEKKIMKLIEEHNLSDKFIFRGFQTNINDELSNMNLMVIPSIQEPFGRILCESAEAKLPCIVADSGGLGELSEKFNIGVRFEGSNFKDLGDKIEFCYDNYGVVKSKYEDSAHDFLSRLNMRDYVQVIEQIFNESMQNKDVSKKWFGQNGE